MVVLGEEKIITLALLENKIPTTFSVFIDMDLKSVYTRLSKKNTLAHLSMFKCHVELLTNLLPDLDDPDYMIMGKYDFEPPDLQIGKEVQVTWEVWDEIFHLQCQVVKRKSEILKNGLYPGSKTEDVFLLRIFVETEDREDKLQRIKEKLLAHNSHLRKKAQV